jgi:hypothetical protein
MPFTVWYGIVTLLEPARGPAAAIVARFARFGKAAGG